MTVTLSFMTWQGEEMRRRNAEIGATATAAVFSFSATVLNAPVAVTAVLGMALFISVGYVWVIVLFGPNVANLERLAVATGLALSIPVLGGLALQAVGISLQRIVWTCLFAGVTLVGDTVLFVRQRKPYPADASRQSTRRARTGWHGLIFGTAIVIAAGAVALASYSATIQHYPGFTQLWLFAREKSALASLGVRNRQGGVEHYRLILLRRGRPSDTWNITLTNGQTWQRVIRISGTSVTAANLYLLPDLTHTYRHVSTAPSETSQS
jgi:hypothetical protein